MYVESFSHSKTIYFESRSVPRHSSRDNEMRRTPMKVDRAIMTVLLSGALALPVMAQSTGSTASGNSNQNSAQQSQSTSTSSGQSMPQSDQQSDTSSGAKKSK